ncbi:5'-3' exoribonuclease 2 [Elasticomyces elasticus]|nr:5'-3' exoribonuclease 2 [Elasticomyces elasticus]KAK3645998.1 5'-3' exoribonuclease 2 [Elasticomyces elasticus]KAK4914865.1 5'-3' exoribonuclease 2 [Elasticomyces elasticus]KAK5754061.1 5'-3' exoribonuclease 2 [Elasticomyces elasticus]
MGVPALFRWLSQKYPKIVSPVIEHFPVEVDNGDGTTTTVPVDIGRPNPNGEQDNLYLDMNSIIHPCSHPEDGPAPANEEEMMIAIFEYTERIVNAVRPRKLLMMAIDGVAPRAKMNQQRSRRFRSAQEAAEMEQAVAEDNALRTAQDREGEGESEEHKQMWDSNAITPGTPFMDTLATSLRYWVRFKLSTDASWQRLKVIVSDATVPGEGEHKIMDFIRSQRSSPSHDPNTRHVLYGLDADLIMLGLATHEPHFRILREDLSTNDVKPGHCRKCNLPGHMADQCRMVPLPKPAEKQMAGKTTLKPYVWLHVGILREYLAVGMNVARLGLDLERVLDDWMFMCLFVGNDFLPHLPSLEIRENGIDTLIKIWIDNIKLMGGYVTFDGQIDLLRAQVVLEGLAKQEATIFKSRRQTELQRDAAAQRRAQAKERREFGMSSGFTQGAMAQSASAGVRHGNDVAMDMNAMILQMAGQPLTVYRPQYAQNLPSRGSGPSRNNLMDQPGATAMHDVLRGGEFVEKNVKVKPEGTVFSEDRRSMWNSSAGVLGKRTWDSVDLTTGKVSYPPSVRDCGKSMPSMSSRSVPGSTNGDPHDLSLEGTVKLWETGYEGRYYAQKFHVSSDDVLFRSRVARAYVEGLSWILLYYAQGCPSWTWYYPYHYAPFATDFVNIGGAVSFDKGTPFRPYELLMGVMPARSNHTIPKVFHPLMTQKDSPIIGFYPETFETDLNGKKYAWQGVVLLPWIDEKRLLDAMETKYHLLTADEIRRNTFGHEDLMFSICHPLYEEMMKTFFHLKGGKLQMVLDPKVSGDLHGLISRSEPYKPDSRLEYPLLTTHKKFAAAEFNDSVTVRFVMPELKAVHRSMLLPGVVCDTPVLQNEDVHGIRGGASRVGRSQGGNGFIPSSARPSAEQRNSTARNGSDRAYGNNNNYRGSTVRGGSNRASGDKNRGSTYNGARSRGENGLVYRRPF